MLLLPGLLPAQHQQHPAARASLCRYLEELQLEGLAKLKDKDLAPLAGLAGLEQLSLRACKQLTSKALPCLAGLTRLRRLDLTGRRRPLCTTTGLDLVRAARGATGHASSSLQRSPRPTPRLPLPLPRCRHQHGPGILLPAHRPGCVDQPQPGRPANGRRGPRCAGPAAAGSVPAQHLGLPGV
jgi:hypothetical protein